MVMRPDTDQYDDVVNEIISLPVRDGTTTEALLYRPTARGPHPAIAIAAEGNGINSFIRRLGATLAHLGYVAIVPDYYRGDGPPDPDNYSDFETLMSYIDRLDFGRAVHDLFDGIEYLRTLDDVDATRIASWGYCTGGTIALFAACLRPDLAAAVVFFPSQPTFDELDAKKPVHAMDMLWNISCPFLLLIGDEDVVLPPDRLEEFRRRLDQWGIDNTVIVYPGAQHAFCAHGSVLYNQQACERSWEDVLAFAAEHLAPTA
jgi:carboxymethylenebutenolidase